MSEMLGNQYFLARKYSLAARELERVLVREPENKEVLRKLIICYVQTNAVDKGLRLLWQLVQQDIEFILHADPLFDDCPCPELVYFFEEQMKIERKVSEDHLLKLAILWLYCDIEKSLQYFHQYQESEPNNTLVPKIIKFLTSYQLHHDVKGNK